MSTLARFAPHLSRTSRGAVLSLASASSTTSFNSRSLATSAPLSARSPINSRRTARVGSSVEGSAENAGLSLDPLAASTPSHSSSTSSLSHSNSSYDLTTLETSSDFPDDLAPAPFKPYQRPEILSTNVYLEPELELKATMEMVLSQQEELRLKPSPPPAPKPKKEERLRTRPTKPLEVRRTILSKDHVFVNKLPHGLTSDALRALFISHGVHATTARILAFPRSDGRFVSRGFGWVTVSPKDLEKALSLSGLEVMGNKIIVELQHQRASGSFDRPPKPKALPDKPVSIPGQKSFEYKRKLDYLAGPNGGRSESQRLEAPERLRPGQQWTGRIAAPRELVRAQDGEASERRSVASGTGQQGGNGAPKSAWGGKRMKKP